MVQACAIKERIGSLHLDSTRPNSQAILDIPVEAYLPDQGDLDILRTEFREIAKVLKARLPYFQVEDGPARGNEIPFCEESSRKSVTVRVLPIYPVFQHVVIPMLKIGRSLAKRLIFIMGKDRTSFLVKRTRGGGGGGGGVHKKYHLMVYGDPHVRYMYKTS